MFYAVFIIWVTKMMKIKIHVYLKLNLYKLVYS